MINKEASNTAFPGIMECIVCGNIFGISDDDEIDLLGTRAMIPGLCKNKTCKDAYDKYLKERGNKK